LRMKATCVRVKIPDEVLHLAVWRDEQDPTIANVEKIWAFRGPRFGIGQLKKNAAIFPFGQLGIFRFVNIDDGLPAFRVVEVTAQHHEGSMLVLKNKWIAPFINFCSSVQRFG